MANNDWAVKKALYFLTDTRMTCCLVKDCRHNKMNKVGGDAFDCALKEIEINQEGGCASFEYMEFGKGKE